MSGSVLISRSTNRVFAHENVKMKKVALLELMNTNRADAWIYIKFRRALFFHLLGASAVNPKVFYDEKRATGWKFFFTLLFYIHVAGD